MVLPGPDQKNCSCRHNHYYFPMSLFLHNSYPVLNVPVQLFPANILPVFFFHCNFANFCTSPVLRLLSLVCLFCLKGKVCCLLKTRCMRAVCDQSLFVILKKIIIIERKKTCMRFGKKMFIFFTQRVEGCSSPEMHGTLKVGLTLRCSLPT